MPCTKCTIYLRPPDVKSSVCTQNAPRGIGEDFQPTPSARRTRRDAKTRLDDGQAPAPLEAAGLQHFAPGARAHPLHKTVFALPRDALRLPCSLHGCLLNPFHTNAQVSIPVPGAACQTRIPIRGPAAAVAASARSHYARSRGPDSSIRDKPSVRLPTTFFRGLFSPPAGLPHGASRRHSAARVCLSRRGRARG